jgi:D-citramalate synthase
MQKKNYIEIMDTTLRDGEQTPGVSFTAVEKKQIARILLAKVKVDRLEIASARVSEGELDAAKSIIEWAEKNSKPEKIEVLGFVDGGKSVDWIKEAGGKTINLLAKGSEAHCRTQLRKTPEQHFSDVFKVIEYAKKQEINVNVYLEDWSNGIKDSFDYVHKFTTQLLDFDIKRIMLPDTLGICNPKYLKTYLGWMLTAFPDVHFDFHGHNDYGLGAANSLQSVQCGVKGLHVTVNSLGERAGNPSLCEVIPIINDMTDFKTHVKEKELGHISELVQSFSGKKLAANAPIVGRDVFTQTCGVHADGDKKGNLYANPLLPQRFGRTRVYALGKLSGKASIDKNLENIGLELDREVRDKVLAEVIRLGDKKKKITPSDLPFIISYVLNSQTDKNVKFVEYEIKTHKKSLPSASLKLDFNGKILDGVSKGDGGYDAFMKALRKALKSVGVQAPKLIGYEVQIPPGGKTDALVETTITWESSDIPSPFTTIGVDSDQMEAAIEATEKMLNICFNGIP